MAVLPMVKIAWHWLTTSRYTRFLEEEIERLRADNLALRASLFSVTGRPGQTYASYLEAQTRGTKPADTKRPEPAHRHVAWSQIKRTLEERDARKAAATATSEPLEVMSNTT